MRSQRNQGRISGAVQSAASNHGPVAVGRFVAPVAGAALSRGGAVMAALLAEWPNIAGPSLASFTSPSKLTKGAPVPGEGTKPAAHLLLKTDPARVLEVQYMIPQLVERINQTLGYRAVSTIRLIQAPVRPPQPKPAAAKPQTPSGGELKAPQTALERALARMKEGVRRQNGEEFTSS
jgi:hypothetical protein